MKSNRISIFIQGDNDEQKQQLIIDTAEAVRLNIKNGHRNDLYKNLMEYQMSIKELIDERLNMESARELLSEKRMSDIEKRKEYIRKFVPEHNQEAAAKEMESFVQNWYDMTAEVMLDELRTMTYMGHLNALCQISEKEEEIRREEAEFEKIHEEIPQMERVSSIIDENRRLPYTAISEKCEIATDEAKRMFRTANAYFVVSKHPEPQKRTVTLSSKGKRFVHYSLNQRKEITREEAEEYVVIASESIISSVQKSLKNQVVCDIHVEGVQPMIKRKLKYEYRKMVEGLLMELKMKESYDIIEERYRIKKQRSLTERSMNGGNDEKIKDIYVY